MKTILIILAIGSILTIIRAIVLSYNDMPKGGNLCTLFTQMQWLNYVPIINFVGLVVVYIHEFFHIKIK